MSIEPKQETTIAVPAEWLHRAVVLLNAMAGEGIGMMECADPADLMCDLADALGAGDADDPWKATLDAIEERSR